MGNPSLTSAGASDLRESEATLLALVEAVARELHSGNRMLPPARLDSSLERELALDSLARVELGARIERAFDCGLSETQLFEAETPRDLLRAVVRSQRRAPLTTTAFAPADTAAVEALPATVTTLADMLAWHVEQHPSRPHIQLYDDFTDGEVLSYGDLWLGATAVAGGLQARGVAAGDRVALMLPTGRDYFLAFYGVVLAGGVPVPIYPPVRRAQLEDHLRRQSRILANCGATMLVTTSDATLAGRLLTVSVASLRHVTDVATLCAEERPFDAVPRAATDTAFLQYTSGSTGDPKGVVLSHANLLANIRADGQGMGVSSQDVFVSWLPLYHDMGLIGAWLGSLYHAVRLVIMPPLSFLARPQRWLWAIHRYHGTLSAAPNFAFELCVSRIRDEDLVGLDLTRWRIAANGAEAISAATLEAFCQRFAPYGFRREAMFPVYGLAECAVGLAFTPLGRGPLIDRVQRDALDRDGRAEPADAAAAPSAVREIVSCGQPLPRHELRVVDRSGRELPERREGRLQFRGPSATAGYFDNPEASARLFDRGWLDTGDLAYIAGGELYVTGRRKDVIIRAGRNIHPTELEDAIGDLAGVRKGHVAVFGVEDPATGTERVVILAETRKREGPAREALHGAINALAADLLGAPADDVVLAPPNAVLRTSSGKIRRQATRALYVEGRLGQRGSALWLQVVRLGLHGIVAQGRRLGQAAGKWLYAGYAWSALALFGSAGLVLGWLPLPAAALWRSERALAHALQAVTGLRPEVTGLEHVPPAGAPCVIASNHQSYLDGIVLFALLPRASRFLIKSELRRMLLLARPLARLGCLFVERFDAAGGVAGLQEAVVALRGGAALSVFPEGTFKRMPGVLPFHMGAFVMAVSARTAVIPVTIHGTRSILRAGSWFPRHGAIRVHIDAPVMPPAGAEGWSAALALRDAVRRHIVAASGEPDLVHESNAVDALERVDRGGGGA